MKRLCITIIIVFVGFKSLYAPDLPEVTTKQKEANMERIIRLDELMSAEFSPGNLKALLFYLEAPHPEIIFNQMKLETGWFRSNVFKNFNNLMGMHYPRIRDSYSFEYGIADNGRKVAIYRSWQSSVLDMLLYIEYYESLGYDSSDYYQFLRDIGYCEKDTYTNILKSMT